jgi:archaellum biogenesis ATPase FlaH
MPTTIAIPPPIPDLIDDLLPQREVSILAGASGAGKTTLLCHLMKNALEGGDFFGQGIRPGLKIGYISGDRTVRALANAAERVGLDLTQIWMRSVPDEVAIEEARMERDPMGLLMELLTSLLPADLIIVDPLVSFFGASPREYHVMGPRLLRVSRWCNKEGATVLGTHHSTKARTDFTFKRPQDRINGSMGLLGFSSTQLFLMEPEDQGPPHHQLFVVSHTAKPLTLALKREENGTFKQLDIVDQKLLDPSVDALSQKLLDLLPHAESGMAVGRDYLRQTLPDVASATLDRRLKLLLREGWARRVSHGEYQRTL